MSWSFKISAPNSPQAAAEAIEVLMKTTKAQTGHDCDRNTIIKAILGATAALSAPDSNQQVVVEAFGSTSGQYGAGVPTRITSVQFSVKADIV